MFKGQCKDWGLESTPVLDDKADRMRWWEHDPAYEQVYFSALR